MYCIYLYDSELNIFCVILVYYTYMMISNNWRLEDKIVCNHKYEKVYITKKTTIICHASV